LLLQLLFLSVIPEGNLLLPFAAQNHRDANIAPASS